jgi:hypothetical protein
MTTSLGGVSGRFMPQGAPTLLHPGTARSHRSSDGITRQRHTHQLSRKLCR